MPGPVVVTGELAGVTNDDMIRLLKVSVRDCWRPTDASAKVDAGNCPNRAAPRNVGRCGLPPQHEQPVEQTSQPAYDDIVRRGLAHATSWTIPREQHPSLLEVRPATPTILLGATALRWWPRVLAWGIR